MWSHPSSLRVASFESEIALLLHSELRAVGDRCAQLISQQLIAALGQSQFAALGQSQLPSENFDLTDGEECNGIVHKPDALEVQKPDALEAMYSGLDVCKSPYHAPSESSWSTESTQPSSRTGVLKKGERLPCEDRIKAADQTELSAQGLRPSEIHSARAVMAGRDDMFSLLHRMYQLLSAEDAKARSHCKDVHESLDACRCNSGVFLGDGSRCKDSEHQTPAKPMQNACDSCAPHDGSELDKLWGEDVETSGCVHEDKEGCSSPRSVDDAAAEEGVCSSSAEEVYTLFNDVSSDESERALLPASLVEHSSRRDIADVAADASGGDALSIADVATVASGEDTLAILECSSGESQEFGHASDAGGAEPRPDCELLELAAGNRAESSMPGESPEPGEPPEPGRPREPGDSEELTTLKLVVKTNNMHSDLRTIDKSASSPLQLSEALAGHDSSTAGNILISSKPTESPVPAKTPEPEEGHEVEESEKLMTLKAKPTESSGPTELLKSEESAEVQEIEELITWKAKPMECLGPVELPKSEKSSEVEETKEAITWIVPSQHLADRSACEVQSEPDVEPDVGDKTSTEVLQLDNAPVRHDHGSADKNEFSHKLEVQSDSQAEDKSSASQLNAGVMSQDEDTEDVLPKSQGKRRRPTFALWNQWKQQAHAPPSSGDTSCTAVPSKPKKLNNKEAAKSSKDGAKSSATAVPSDTGSFDAMKMPSEAKEQELAQLRERLASCREQLQHEVKQLKEGLIRHYEPLSEWAKTFVAHLEADPETRVIDEALFELTNVRSRCLSCGKEPTLLDENLLDATALDSCRSVHFAPAKIKCRCGTQLDVGVRLVFESNDDQRSISQIKMLQLVPTRRHYEVMNHLVVRSCPSRSAPIIGKLGVGCHFMALPFRLLDDGGEVWLHLFLQQICIASHAAKNCVAGAEKLGGWILVRETEGDQTRLVKDVTQRHLLLIRHASRKRPIANDHSQLEDSKTSMLPVLPAQRAQRDTAKLPACDARPELQESQKCNKDTPAIEETEKQGMPPSQVEHSSDKGATSNLQSDEVPNNLQCRPKESDLAESTNPPLSLLLAQQRSHYKPLAKDAQLESADVCVPSSSSTSPATSQETLNSKLERLECSICMPDNQTLDAHGRWAEDELFLNVDKKGCLRGACQKCGKCQAWQQHGCREIGWPLQSSTTTRSVDSICASCGCADSDHENLTKWLTKAKIRVAQFRDPELTLRRVPPTHPLPAAALMWTTTEIALYVLSWGRVDPRLSGRIDSCERWKEPLPFRGVQGLISVCVPTCTRRQPWHPLLYENFQRQKYPHRELVIVDTGVCPSAFLQRKAKEDPRVFYYFFPVKDADHDRKYACCTLPRYIDDAVDWMYVPAKDTWSLGFKRNVAAHLSRGACIAQFDDDDLYAPDYLSHMQDRLFEAARRQGRENEVVAGAFPALVTLSQWHTLDIADQSFRFFDPKTDPKTDSTWRLSMMYGYGFTYLYTRAAWDVQLFPDREESEEDVFSSELKYRRGAIIELAAMPSESIGLAAHSKHPGNTGVMEVTDTNQRLGKRLGRVPTEFQDLMPLVREVSRKLVR